jgi:hypothetical protein
VTEPVLWDLEPHTAAKHRVLRAYLDAWIPVMAPQALRVRHLMIGEPRLLLVDAFAGPGRYATGEPGSPLIMLDAVLSRPAAKDLLREDLADVLGKRPVVITFATPLLCQSRVCGPTVDIVEQARQARPRTSRSSTRRSTTTTRSTKACARSWQPGGFAPSRGPSSSTAGAGSAHASSAASRSASCSAP